MSEQRADLVQLRARGAAYFDAPEAVVFTCDNCDAAPECEFAFDPYNTDGDCLAEK